MTSHGPVPEGGQAPKAKVFISYSRKDLDFADRLAAALDARSFEPLAADRSNIQWQRDLAVGHSKLASVYEAKGRVADALHELVQARDMMIAVVAIDPANARWKNDLTWLEQEIARLRAQASAR
jgi:hypothetical protein